MSARRLELAVPSVVALGIGILWSLDHRLRPSAMLAIVAAHGGAGLLLGALLGPIARRICPRASLGTLAVAVFLVFGVVPALISHPLIVGRGASAYLPIAAAAAAIALALALAAGRLGWIGLGALAAAALGATFALSPSNAPILPAPRTVGVQPGPGVARRVALIGIDSGDWQVIDPLLAAGEMPNLARLIDHGGAGVLRSIQPISSPVVWSSIFSGKVPAKHGITDWGVAHAGNLRAAMLWHLVGNAGLPAVAVDVPGSWPPRHVHGALVSGFPIPSVTQPPPMEQQEILGRVLATQDRPGALVPTTLLEAADGEATGMVTVGVAQTPPCTRLHNFGIDALMRHHLLPRRLERIPVRFDVRKDGKRRIEAAGHAVELATGEWSPWLAADLSGIPVRFRLRALEGGGFYSTPVFQDPLAPLYPFASEPDLMQRVHGAAMYVVEGTGWRMAQDRDLRRPFFEELEDVAEEQVTVAQELARMVPDWVFFAHVFTITDRASHAFWRFHDPNAFPPIDPTELAECRDFVRESYRWTDAALGRLLETLGDDVTVFVVSDHGSRADPSRGFGGHRVEGMWVAAGPGIVPWRDRRELSILDIAPTVLVALGLPVAADMDGTTRTELLAAAPEPRRIATYEVGGGKPGGGAPQQIDESTESQLRSLGYVE